MCFLPPESFKTNVSTERRTILISSPSFPRLISEYYDQKMCRGYQPNERERLKIKAFYLHLSFSTRQKTLPDSLTLHFLPRINGGSLEINGSSIRPDTPAFITMYRVLSAGKAMTQGVVYGSREKMKATEGSRFEIYMGDVKVLKGVFRKDEGENWKLECKCGLQSDEVDFLKEADVCVAIDGRDQGAMNEKVEMVRRRKRRGRCFQGLEEIPEEREGQLEHELEPEEGGGCGSSSCCCDECINGSGMMVVGGDSSDVEVEIEGVKWAVDVGIWVMCLGVGYLVTKASRRRFRHTRLF